jgi:hypothetical protein
MPDAGWGERVSGPTPEHQTRRHGQCQQTANPLTRETRPGRGEVCPRVEVEGRIINVAAPAGSRFKGYEPCQIQELVLTVHVVRYLLERWETPDGQTIVAPLPEGIQGHFGPDLRRFVLM